MILFPEAVFLWYNPTMNYTLKKLLVLSALAFAAAGCTREDMRDFTVDVPQATEADVPALVASLARYNGVDRATIAFDAATRRLSLKYDSMQLAKKNIEMAIAAAGFTANGVTPESIGAKPRK